MADIDFLNRRQLIAGFAGLLVSGCVKDPGVYNAFSVFHDAIFGRADQQIDRATVARVPYALIRAKIGKKAGKSVLVLSRIQQDEQSWSSADRATLILDHGRLIRTVGLTENIAGTHFSRPDPLARSPQKLTTPTAVSRVIDIKRNDRLYTYLIESTMAPAGPRTIDILGMKFDTLLLRESNRLQGSRWAFENLYWVDVYDGFIWKSIQYISRRQPPLEYEVLKPPAA